MVLPAGREVPLNAWTAPFETMDAPDPGAETTIPNPLRDAGQLVPVRFADEEYRASVGRLESWRAGAPVHQRYLSERRRGR